MIYVLSSCVSKVDCFESLWLDPRQTATRNICRKQCNSINNIDKKHEHRDSINVSGLIDISFNPLPQEEEDEMNNDLNAPKKLLLG